MQQTDGGVDDELCDRQTDTDRQLNRGANKLKPTVPFPWHHFGHNFTVVTNVVVVMSVVVSGDD